MESALSRQQQDNVLGRPQDPNQAGQGANPRPTPEVGVNLDEISSFGRRSLLQDQGPRKVQKLRADGLPTVLRLLRMARRLRSLGFS